MYIGMAGTYHLPKLVGYAKCIYLNVFIHMYSYAYIYTYLGMAGTYHLPKLVGYPTALDMILTGKHKYRYTYQMGLVDLCIWIYIYIYISIHRYIHRYIHTYLFIS
jgi:enoyl-CoA hydratase/carnithine racemase